MKRYMIQDSQADTEDEDPAAPTPKSPRGRPLVIGACAIKAVKSFGNNEESDEKRRLREN